MTKKAESVTPGQRLGYSADYNQGPGTYERDGLLYASVVGQRYIDPAKDGQVKHNIIKHVDLELILCTVTYY
jgi:exosome complex component CSL4